MDKGFVWGLQGLTEMDNVTNIASRVKARKFLRDRGRKRKRNKKSEYVVLSSEDTEAEGSEGGRSWSPSVDTSASERTLSDTESKMVRRRTERRKRRYGFDRDQPSSSRRLNRAGEKTPSGSIHMELRMESGDSLYGRRESRGIPMGDGIEFIPDNAAYESLSRSGARSRDAQSERRAGNARTEVPEPSRSRWRGDRVNEAAQPEKSTQSAGSNHMKRRGSGSHFSMESGDSLYGRLETVATGGSSRGRRRGIPMGNGQWDTAASESLSKSGARSRDVQSEGRTGNASTEVPGASKSWWRRGRVKEAVRLEKTTQSAGADNPRTDPDFLIWKKLFNKELGFQTSRDDQTQNQEEKEEEEVQVLPDQRCIFRGWDPTDTGIELVGENVNEALGGNPAKLQKTRGRPRKAPVQKAMESEMPRPPPLYPDHADSSSSETDHDDEDYMLGLSEKDESEISVSDEDAISGDTAVDKAGCAKDAVREIHASKRLKKTSSHCVSLTDVENRLLEAIFDTEGSVAADGNAVAKDIIPEEAVAKEHAEETIPADVGTDAGNAQVESDQEQIVAKGRAQESIDAGDDSPRGEFMTEVNVEEGDAAADNSAREEVMSETNVEEGDAATETFPEQVIAKGGFVDAADTPGEEVMMDAHDEEPNATAENIAKGCDENIANEAAKDAHYEPLCYTVEQQKRSIKSILKTNGDKEKAIPVELAPERQSCGAKRGKSSDGTRKTIVVAGSSKKPHQPRNRQEPVLVAERSINARCSAPQEASKILESNSIPHDQPSGPSANPETDNGKEATAGDGTEKHSKKKIILVPTQKKLVNVLIESILGDGSVIEEEAQQEPMVEPTSWNSSTLPLKFRFEDEDPEPVVKTDAELEVEALFEESGLNGGMFGDESYYEKEEIKKEAAVAEELKKLSCEHELYIDYSIGLICRHCFYIAKYIKDIDPEFIAEHVRPQRCADRDRLSLLDSLNFTPEEAQLGVAFRAENGTVWDAIPGAKARMYEHQQEGFEFMWKNLEGTIELAELKNSEDINIGGCIISHAPGTGKTLLTLMFINSYLKIFPNSRPMIIAPASMLLTWEEEFKKWNMDFPFHNLGHIDFTGKEKKILDTPVPTGRSMDKDVIRLIKIYSWTKERSVLGISYNLFENLVGGEYKKVRKTKKVEPKHTSKVGQHSHKYKKMLLDMPRLVIMDEGHTPRNSNSCIWNTVLKLQTKRKIILTGTPFQNNFSELFNTLRLVRPETADSLLRERAYAPMLAVKGGKYAQKKKVETLEASEQPSVDKAIEKLKDIISPFVHVHKGHILRRSLPGLKDSVILLKPPPLQKQLIKIIEGTRAASSFDYEYKVALMSTHPCLAVHCSLDARERGAINMDEVVSLKDDYKEGVKTRFVMELVRLSIAMNEKVLVFSQYQQVHKLLSEQMRSVFKWEEGRQVIQMHGKQVQKHRQHTINKFNDPKSEVVVLLASTKCCSEGINLVGASRVVLLDVVWNPSVERQAISRAYRLGQQKVVHTYHLMAGGTSEGDKYCRQVEKDRLSELVFSSTTKENVTEQDPVTASASASYSASSVDDAILHRMLEDDNFKDMVEKIIYQPKEVNLIESFTLASADRE